MSSEESSSKDATVIDDDLVAALGFEPTVRSVDPGDSVLVAADEFDGDGFDSDAAADRNGVELLDTHAAGAAFDDTVLDDTVLEELAPDDATVEGDTSPDETALDDASLDDASLDETALEDASLDDASLDDASLDETALEDASLDDASLDDASLDETALDDASLDDASLDDASLDDTAPDDGVSDDEAVLEDEGATLVDADLIDLTDSPDGALPDGALPDVGELDEALLDEAEATDVVDADSDLDLDIDHADDQLLSSVFADPDVVDREGLDGDVEGAESDLAIVDRHTDDGLANATATAGASATAATQLAEEPARRRRRTATRARKSRRVLRHVDPWSVLTFSVLFHLCFFAALLLASVLVWRAADAAGTIGNAESFIMELGDYESFEIDGDAVFRSALLIAGMLTLASSIMVVLLTVVFNLISDLIGGIRVTVLEEETVRLPAKAPKKTM